MEWFWCALQDQSGDKYHSIFFPFQIRVFDRDPPSWNKIHSLDEVWHCALLCQPLKCLKPDSNCCPKKAKCENVGHSDLCVLYKEFFAD